MPKRGPHFSRFVLNCGESVNRNNDWTYEDAANAQDEIEKLTTPSPIITTNLRGSVPEAVDLRRPWWTIRDQGRNGACVGFATADGVLRWLYVTAGKIKESELPSPRFIWMANKETDDITRYPTTFIERAGTSTKLALSIAQKYGCVLEHMLPMNGTLSKLPVNVFFSIAAQFRISAYYNLGNNIHHWKAWLAHAGPILTRLDVDRNWKNVKNGDGNLEVYDESTSGLYGGHAVCLVGYTRHHFIIRNSWGTGWGDNGFAYASYEYAQKAFGQETYGAIL